MTPTIEFENVSKRFVVNRDRQDTVQGWFSRLLRRQGRSAVSYQYTVDDRQRAERFARLQACATQVLQQVPQARLALDSPGRHTDIAIDHSEHHRLDRAGQEAVLAVMRSHGLTATVSSIHINGWLGEHDKWSGARWAVQTVLGQPLEPGRWIYVGDSANDEVSLDGDETPVAAAVRERAPADPTTSTLGGNETPTSLAHELRPPIAEPEDATSGRLQAHTRWSTRLQLLGRRRPVLLLLEDAGADATGSAILAAIAAQATTSSKWPEIPRDAEACVSALPAVKRPSPRTERRVGRSALRPRRLVLTDLGGAGEEDLRHAVAAWGVCIALAGFMDSLWPAAALFALAGLGAHAQSKDIVVDPKGDVPYAIDQRNVVVKSGADLCWRTGSWTPAAAGSVQAGELPVGCQCDRDVVGADICQPPAARGASGAPAAAVAAPAAVRPEPEEAGRLDAGYRETAHVRAYYDTCR